MAAYYNEIDRDAAQWLRNLIAARLIPEGDVDERSIELVQPGDVAGYSQCHFFAGLGGWPYALRLAAWPDDRPVWTGSCPCQPFSVAGKQEGTADSRHLWPEFHRLISAGRPDVVMGEQVSGAPGYAWLDGVRTDFEAQAYACRAVDIPACSAGAPHIRNRLYWLAEPNHAIGRAEESRGNKHHRHSTRRLESHGDAEVSGGDAGGLDLPLFAGPQGLAGDVPDWRQSRRLDPQSNGPSAAPGLLDYWADFILVGPDPKGKYRRVKSGIALLASGVSARVAKLRAIGNAICAPLAAEVIRAYMEVKSEGLAA